ncbi:hypothetical protein PR048_005901 [Dryococelus australis]|uniref:tRNA N(3)-methylcytidine methyltransferase n=1 Tax=Dryococelus australis TaxID=614101 RepID=A0ABQ9I9G7_9NEOP|nr:hypothetical protein PR048_005901 [Dryococelus australis]
MAGNSSADAIGHYARKLNSNDLQKLKEQDLRRVSDYQAKKLELETKKNWDLFYKRNSNRFFKDRHWTRREFEELLCNMSFSEGSLKKMLEVGCGVGNLIYPLLEDGFDMFIYACDISHSAVELLKMHPMYSENDISAFQCDITTDCIFTEIPADSLDVITLIFVLSAIHPDKFEKALRNLYMLLKPGGIVLFRDYGLYDMAQLRFKPGHKIADNFYMRQDGTRMLKPKCVKKKGHVLSAYPRRPKRKTARESGLANKYLFQHTGARKKLREGRRGLWKFPESRIVASVTTRWHSAASQAQHAAPQYSHESSSIHTCFAQLCTDNSYYFSEEYLEKLFSKVGFKIITNSYIQRRTVNKKDGIDVPRIFIQTKCSKPSD